MQAYRKSHSFSARLECRYLLEPPAAGEGKAVLVVATHGYAMNAAAMLDLTRRMLGPAPAIVSIEAPHQHYLLEKPGKDLAAAYNWGIAPHKDANIRLHHQMLLQVIEECRERFEVPAERVCLVGFSQPVALNYRFAAAHPEQVRGVIALCGGVPGDWDDSGRPSLAVSVLHIARDQDEYYPPPTVPLFEERLRARAADVEFHLLPGLHRFPSQAGPIARKWLRRVFPPL